MLWPTSCLITLTGRRASNLIDDRTRVFSGRSAGRADQGFIVRFIHKISGCFLIRLPWIAIILLFSVLSASARDKPGSRRVSSTDAPLTTYQLTVEMSYRTASFTGREEVSFANETREAIDSVSFYLYPNIGLEEESKPRLVIHRVTVSGRDAPFSFQSRGFILRVVLPNKVGPGERSRVTIDFSATIPSVQPDETSLLAHFLDEINDAIGEERAENPSREIFFAANDAILLGYFFPMLATREVRDSDRMPASGVKSAICSEVANYDVRVVVEAGITVIGSGRAVKRDRLQESEAGSGSQQVVEFQARKLRGFALIFGEQLKSVDRVVQGTAVTSYFRAGSERLGVRMLELATRAVDTFGRTFGPYASQTLQVIELPLPASFSGIDLPGIVVLSHAYFVDFDSPQPHLPGIVRAQSDVIKAALEFTLAHEIAHQWWGGIVGSDPRRDPFLDESLAQFSAIYLYETTEGSEIAEKVIEQQVRGTYFTYRMFGGLDTEVERPLRDFRSRLQYAAITQAKGAFFLIAMRRQLGDERFFSALRSYCEEHRYSISSAEKLRVALLNVAEDPRALRVTMRRWLNEKHGDEDIGNPGITVFPQANTGMRKLGRIFVWIGRAAARPF